MVGVEYWQDVLMIAVFIVAVLEDNDLITVVQTLITKCMESEELCNEFYLQLIKQTTDTPSGKLGHSN